jgi:hypothetical protein
VCSVGMRLGDGGDLSLWASLRPGREFFLENGTTVLSLLFDN